MPTLLERLAVARERRHEAEEEFREALIAAREFHSWPELAAVSGLSVGGVRWLVLEGKSRPPAWRKRAPEKSRLTSKGEK